MKMTPDSAIWLGLADVVLVGAAFVLLGDRSANIVRGLITLVAIILPLLVMLVAGQAKARGWVDHAPTPLILVLSGAAGLAIWPISWWGMSYINTQLIDFAGVYSPPFVRWESWTFEVIYMVVLLPLAWSLVVFGALRTGLRAAPRLATLSILAVFVATLSIMTTPQGIVGLFGYGLLGLVASFIALHTDSMWGGFATLGTFMYANLTLLDELFAQFGTLNYVESDWLLLVLVTGFLTLLLTQIIRFRHTDTTPTAKLGKTHLGLLSWAAMVGVLLVVVLYTVSELSDRSGG